MKKEFNLIKELGPLNVDGFLNPHTEKYGCRSCFQGYTIHDARNDGSEATILKSMDYMQYVVGTKKGLVNDLIKKKSFKSGPEVQKHFETKLVLPFHQK